MGAVMGIQPGSIGSENHENLVLVSIYPIFTARVPKFSLTKIFLLVSLPCPEGNTKTVSLMLVLSTEEQ
jgi:hypothetical protein